MRRDIITSDCFDFMEAQPAQSFDCYIGDIPYNQASGFVEGGIRKINRDLADKDTDGSVFDAYRHAKEVCRLTRDHLLIFCGDEQIHLIRQAIKEDGNWGMLRLVAWCKDNVSPVNGQWGLLNAVETAVYARRKGAEYYGGHCTRNFFMNPTRPLDWHETAKPVDLLCKFVELFCKPEGVVLDTTAGSFTTAVAANKMGRGYCCVEKNPEFVEKAKQFWNVELNQQSLF